MPPQDAGMLPVSRLLQARQAEARRQTRHAWRGSISMSTARPTCQAGENHTCGGSCRLAQHNSTLLQAGKGVTCMQPIKNLPAEVQGGQTRQLWDACPAGRQLSTQAAI